MNEIMNGAIELGDSFPAIVLQILIVTQGLKRMLERHRWIAAVLEKLTGTPGLSATAVIVLTIVVGVLANLQTVTADGVLSLAEIWQVVLSTLSAAGVHDLSRRFRKPVVESDPA